MPLNLHMLCMLWLNAILFHLYFMILYLNLTSLAFATPILIGRPVLCLYKYLMGTIPWLVYLVILSRMLNLLLWTLFARKLLVVQLLGSCLSVWFSLLMPWGHVVLLLVGILGTPRLIFRIFCVLSFLMYLNCSETSRARNQAQDQTIAK